LSIGEHEVKGLEFLHLINRIDKGEAEDNKLVERKKVLLNFVIIFFVDVLIGDQLCFVSEALGVYIGANIISFQKGHTECG
jgi:hypothetical protein